MALEPRQWVLAWREQLRQCEYRREKVALAVIGAILSAGLLRAAATLGALMLPSDTWASDLAHQVMSLSGMHFWLAAAVATFGGAASLFHELRVDMTRFTLPNALGHMIIAQFAGLMLYLLTVSYEQPVPLALATCGGAGWGGGKLITMVSDAIMRRLGITERSP